MSVKKFWLLAVFFFLITSCGKPSDAQSVEYILTTSVKDGVSVFLGVGDEINGIPNPELHAAPGQKVTITFINGKDDQHQIHIPAVNAKSGLVYKKGEMTSVTFTAPERPIVIEYQDAAEGAASISTIGLLVVSDNPRVATPADKPADAEPTAPGLYDKELAQSAFTKGGCGACHTIPGVPGAIGTLGPDLSLIGKIAAEIVSSPEYTGKAATAVDYIHEGIVDPAAYVPAECPAGPCQKGLMPETFGKTYSKEELDAIVNYLGKLTSTTVSEPATAITPTPASGETTAVETDLLNPDQFAWAKQTYFERCAGCHGTLRKGATGPGLTPDLMTPKGTIALAAIIFNGTTRGMPDWGKQGFFTQEQTDVMAKYLQIEPPMPPELSLEQMQSSWKLIISPDQRPDSPQSQRDWENYSIVTLRDAGQVAIIDGDTYEVITKVNTGYAVHITRMSATGRYAYVIGRDGKLAMIDLWMETPDKVAEVQLCYDARSVEVSKYEGEEGDFRDQLAIVGCYWPPHFVILNGQTLEPMKVISTRSYTYDTGEYHPEPRVASILASHFKPEWVVNIKETGQIWLVNYVDPYNPGIKMIEAERFLHDGGLDASKRYFLVAANQSNRIAVVDLKEGKLTALVDTGKVPHPGRGANWIDPEFGPVWSTSHLGEPSIVSIGTDPEGHPDSAWKAVRTTILPGAGSLFLKTHPNSKWIWVDMTLNSDPVLARTICVIAKSDPTKPYKCWEASTYGRAVHFDYNKAGTEVWVSIWGTADKPGETGEIVIYTDETLEEKARIPDLITPTGKFNVFNTVNDVY